MDRRTLLIEIPVEPQPFRLYVLCTVIASQKSADNILRTMPLAESARLIWPTFPPVAVVMVGSPTATRADLNVLTSDATR